MRTSNGSHVMLQCLAAFVLITVAVVRSEGDAGDGELIELLRAYVQDADSRQELRDALSGVHSEVRALRRDVNSARKELDSYAENQASQRQWENDHVVLHWLKGAIKDLQQELAELARSEAATRELQLASANSPRTRPDDDDVLQQIKALRRIVNEVQLQQEHHRLLLFPETEDDNEAGGQRGRRRAHHRIASKKQMNQAIDHIEKRIALLERTQQASGSALNHWRRESVQLERRLTSSCESLVSRASKDLSEMLLSTSNDVDQLQEGCHSLGGKIALNEKASLDLSKRLSHITEKHLDLESSLATFQQELSDRHERDALKQSQALAKLLLAARQKSAEAGKI